MIPPFHNQLFSQRIENSLVQKKWPLKAQTTRNKAAKSTLAGWPILRTSGPLTRTLRYAREREKKINKLDSISASLRTSSLTSFLKKEAGNLQTRKFIVQK